MVDPSPVVGLALRVMPTGASAPFAHLKLSEDGVKPLVFCSDTGLVALPPATPVASHLDAVFKITHPEFLGYAHLG